MTEKMKSIILTVLVALSLLLTYQLWYGKQPAELVVEDSFEKVIVETPRPLLEVFFPWRLVIPAEEGLIIPDLQEAGYKAVWEQALASLSVLEKEPLGLAAVKQDSEELARFYFKPLLPAALIEELGELFPGLLVSGLQLKRLDGQLWLVASDSEEGPVYASELSAEVSAALEEALLDLKEKHGEHEDHYFLLSEDMLYLAGETSIVIEDPIILPSDPRPMASYNLRPETYNRDQLLKTFFVDYSLARIIEEKDGSLIYTDGEKGLRLTVSSLEYSNPRYEQNASGLEYYEALLSGNSYISHHGGWPEDLRLVALEKSSKNPAASFEARWQMYVFGYPLFTQQQTRAIFNDRGLVHYVRSVYLVDETLHFEEEFSEVAPWQEALKKAVSLLDEEGAGVRKYLRLEMVELGYAALSAGQNLVATPAWCIAANGKTFYLKADTLEQIKAGELK